MSDSANTSVEIRRSNAARSRAQRNPSESDIKIYPKLTAALQRCRWYARLQLL